VYLPCKNRVKGIQNTSKLTQKKLESPENPNVPLRIVTAEKKDVKKSKAGQSTIPLSAFFTFKNERLHRIGACRNSLCEIIRIRKFQVYKFPKNRIRLEQSKIKLIFWPDRSLCNYKTGALEVSIRGLNRNWYIKRNGPGEHLHT